jgi:uncharacterized protein (TIGR02284 family)
MNRDNLIDRLNQLVHINKDAETGLLAAAENVKNSELETLFSGYAKQHAKFVTELEEEIKRLAGDFSDSRTLGGTLHQGWLDLKSTLSGHSAPSLLATCENGEQSAAVAYADAAKAEPSGQAHTVIERHLHQIEAFRTRLARLVGETKDGVEFQDNE